MQKENEGAPFALSLSFVTCDRHGRRSICFGGLGEGGGIASGVERNHFTKASLHTRTHARTLPTAWLMSCRGTGNNNSGLQRKRSWLVLCAGSVQTVNHPSKDSTTSLCLLTYLHSSIRNTAYSNMERDVSRAEFFFFYQRLSRFLAYFVP